MIAPQKQNAKNKDGEEDGTMMPSNKAQFEFAILPPAPRSLDPLPTLRERYLAAIKDDHYPWARRHHRHRFTEYDQFRAIWQDELWHWLYGDNPRGIGSLTVFAWKVQHARISNGGRNTNCLNWSNKNQRLYLGDGLLDYLGLLKDEVERLYSSPS